MNNELFITAQGKKKKQSFSTDQRQKRPETLLVFKTHSFVHVNMHPNLSEWNKAAVVKARPIVILDGSVVTNSPGFLAL